MTYAATRRIFGKANSNLSSRFILESKAVPETALKPDEEDIQESMRRQAKRRSRMGKAKGQRVRHNVYGTGRIIGRSGSGEAAKITVLFDKGGIQTFMLRYAQLEMVN